ncbi:Tn3 family transposase [Romboutsia sedimentorum]|uniref:Tn3 family transposase n=1 Tax=Romboutsia sedimentorum TaxID=1368474 RepID=UPI0024DE7390|nr:Tn3 family transposase [Romboutsia sedimentorum]MDK2587516.1 Tn3 family transposase [Romboutsia sedimentorum]
MTLESKTIYPKFNNKISMEELQSNYLPSKDEINLANSKVKGKENLYIFLINLKVFQNLHYFVDESEIPFKITRFIKSSIKIDKYKPIVPNEKTVSRYRKYIRQTLNINYNSNCIKTLVLDTVEKHEPMMENKADIFNAVLESLIRSNCELPAFSTIDKWIRSKRLQINNDLFKYISNNLTLSEKQLLDSLLVPSENNLSKFNYIKNIPKSPSLTHLKEVRDNYIYLKNIHIGKKMVSSIPSAKVDYFTSQVNPLDAAEMKDFSDDKRYTLLICFIYKSLIKTGDDLITMFIKRLGKIHNKAKDNLTKLLENQRSKEENTVNVFMQMLSKYQNWNTLEFEDKFKIFIEENGGHNKLVNDCAELTAYHNNNYYPLLSRQFKSHRSVLFEIIKLLPIKSSSKNNSLIKAIEYLLTCENRKSDFIDANVDLSFANEKWRKFVITKKGKTEVFIRKNFEICVFSCISSEFKTGDLCSELSEEYADYKNQLLSLDECKSMINEYCSEMDLPNNSKDFIETLKNQLDQKAKDVNNKAPESSELTINPNGEIVLTKRKSTRNLAKIKVFKRLFESKMPERNIVEIICMIEKMVNFTRHFGPLSGSETKFSDAQARYVLLTFGYGSNLGPTQTSKHVKGSITPREIQFTNQRHITAENLDKAINDIINKFNMLSLPTLWGDINTAAADGTKIDLYSENLLSEYHIRYGGYGGIAYHHVSDRYVALFSHFIPCGVWEAVYIIDGLLKNKSDIQPDTIHADTQGQSATVFALTHLLGIKLMPRIRNWKDLKFYKPYKESSYKHIDVLFKDTIKWDIIETHFDDLFQVILSIKAGKILPSTLLRKLNNYSKKNKLFQAFRELGNVIRTMYLLDFISDIELREKITESINKTESYNAFASWSFFGGEGVIRENNLDDQTKSVKYNDLLANILILQNTIDMENVVKQLKSEGIDVSKQDIKNLSPYLTSHIKRFGEYVIDLAGESDPINPLEINKFLK